MASKTTKEYFCDVCGAKMPDKNGAVLFKCRAMDEEAVVTIKMDDICDSCAKDLIKTLSHKYPQCVEVTDVQA